MQMAPETKTFLSLHPTTVKIDHPEMCGPTQLLLHSPAANLSGKIPARSRAAFPM